MYYWEVGSFGRWCLPVSLFRPIRAVPLCSRALPPPPSFLLPSLPLALPSFCRPFQRLRGKRERERERARQQTTPQRLCLLRLSLCSSSTRTGTSDDERNGNGHSERSVTTHTHRVSRERAEVTRNARLVATKRNETKRNETKRNETKRDETEQREAARR